MDYISREKLRQAMYHEAFETDTDLQKWESGCWIRYKLFENVIEALPAADVLERNALQHTQCVESLKNALDVPERNVGKWLPYEFGDYHWHKCSVCGKADKYIDTVIRGNGAEHDLTAVRNFCPNCGAKMEDNE